MSYILDGQTIRRPTDLDEQNDTQTAENRTLAGTITRDQFGSNKRKWVYRVENSSPTDYATIKAIYDSYLSTGTTKTWEVTESNYTVSQTNVHIDLKTRGFRVRGNSYLTNFTLILTEA